MLRESTSATEDLGEGLYTKSSFQTEGVLLAYFNGIRIRKTFMSYHGNQCSLKTVKIRSIYTILQFIIEQFHVLVGIDDDISNEFSGYSINVEPGLSLDIPKSAYSTSKYCATLG